jgi:hypothetical protein
MDVVGVGRVVGFSVGHLGSDRMVLLHAYATEKEFPQQLPAFERINEAFRYDAGHEFTPGGGGGFWGGVANGAGRGAIIGAVAGGLIGLVVLVGKLTKKSAKKKGPDDDYTD